MSCSRGNATKLAARNNYQTFARSMIRDGRSASSALWHTQLLTHLQKHKHTLLPHRRTSKPLSEQLQNCLGGKEEAPTKVKAARRVHETTGCFAHERFCAKP
mmetsp:Transcript_106151/g.210919  ORF Transcript_106151/g.210919 Transcript_106151/m.210919 type:complete len:102 (-) Transcript_106151:712-1017(-)